MNFNTTLCVSIIMMLMINHVISSSMPITALEVLAQELTTTEASKKWNICCDDKKITHVDPDLVVQWIPTDGKNSWEKNSNRCSSQNKQLCTYDQLCPTTKTESFFEVFGKYKATQEQCSCNYRWNTFLSVYSSFIVFS